MFLALIPERVKTGSTVAVLAGGLALVLIAVLTFNVTRETRLLGSASSDNIQWSLAQTEVELLVFAQELTKDPVNLDQLRQSFNVFYSRMTTVRSASVFQTLRDTPRARSHLDDIVEFLDSSVVLIDDTDEELLSRLNDLINMTSEVAKNVRRLANSGLSVFARSSDAQRNEVSRTMSQLAIALAVLVGTLAFGLFYLNRLNNKIYIRERERNQTAKRMKTVTDTSLDGVIIFHADSKIIEFSRAAETIFGHNEEDVLGLDIDKIFLSNHKNNAHCSGMERLSGCDGKGVVGKGRVAIDAIRSNGDVFPIELAVQVAVTDEGKIFIAFVRDISLRVAAKAELVAALDKAISGEKTKSDFLATMSHEIRTPLNGLLGNMSLLRDTGLNVNQGRYLGHMETCGRLLMNHISDVLDITRYDAGKLNTNLEPLNVSALLQDIIDTQQSTASQNGTTLHWEWVGAKMDWIISDHDKLLHVMMNLIGNAVKFTKGGEVLIAIESIGESDFVEMFIKVTDTGIGIADNLVMQVFDDFVTGDTAYDREVGGTGLGLSIAKRFVIAMGGQIGVNSVVGEGSTFWVKLPVTQIQPPVLEEALVVPFSKNALHVLLVEDNAINRIVAREMLQADGHTVVEAHDGRQGVTMSKTAVFDLILMDISMPIMDGRVATRAIRREGGPSAKSPIVALTANANPEEQEWFKQDGMDAILTKPLSRDVLRRVVQETNTGESISSICLLNNKHIEETRDALGEVAFAQLISRFVKEMDELYGWLVSDDIQDFDVIEACVHKVAGSAAIFGADKLKEILNTIENSSKADEGLKFKEQLIVLNNVWRLTKFEILS